MLRADAGALVGGVTVSKLVRGAEAVAGQALAFRRFAASSRLVRVNGEAGVVAIVDGRPQSVMGVTVADGRIVAMYILADPERLARLDLGGAKPGSDGQPVKGPRPSWSRTGVTGGVTRSLRCQLAPSTTRV